MPLNTPLLDPSGEEGYYAKPCSHCRDESFTSNRPRRLRSRIPWFILCSIVAGLAIVGVVSLLTTNRNRFSPEKHLVTSKRPTLYTPFEDGIRYKTETTSPDYWDSDLYMGKPSVASERAWNNLIRPGREHGVRLYREEARHLNINESILLPDNNFAVIITVHHNLHCLRKLRQTFFEDHYYPHWTDEDRMHDREHTLHCLESLRQSMICQPDIAPLPYYWSGNEWHEMNARPQVKRECVNWEFFSEHLKTRSYHYEDLVKDW